MADETETTERGSAEGAAPEAGTEAAAERTEPQGTETGAPPESEKPIERPTELHSRLAASDREIRELRTQLKQLQGMQVDPELARTDPLRAAQRAGVDPYAVAAALLGAGAIEKPKPGAEEQIAELKRELAALQASQHQSSVEAYRRETLAELSRFRQENAENYEVLSDDPDGDEIMLELALNYWGQFREVPSHEWLAEQAEQQLAEEAAAKVPRWRGKAKLKHLFDGSAEPKPAAKSNGKARTVTTRQSAHTSPGQVDRDAMSDTENFAYAMKRAQEAAATKE